jgi:hypothetical protein
MGVSVAKRQAAWQRAAGLVEYVGALRLHAEGLPPGPAREEAEAWIAWAESHVQRLNPLNGSPLLPEIPEPRTEDLKLRRTLGAGGGLYTRRRD